MESGNASDGCENYLDPDDGDYDLMNSGLESAGDASDWDEPKTISSKAVKRKSSKNYDKRAHINRDNWNEDMSAALIAQVERHPGLFNPHPTRLVVYVSVVYRLHLLPYFTINHSHLGSVFAGLSEQDSKRSCVGPSAHRCHVIAH